MTEHATAVAIARALTAAWTSQDMDTAASFVAEDVVFDGPLGHVEGKAAYLQSLSQLARNFAVSGVRVVAVFGNATQALMVYELLTGRFGALTCCKLLTIRDGTIQTDRLTFDSYAVRTA